MAWEIIVSDSQILAIHAALLPTGDGGEILYFGGDEHSMDQHNAGDIDHTRLFDLAVAPADAISTLPSPKPPRITDWHTRYSQLGSRIALYLTPLHWSAHRTGYSDQYGRTRTVHGQHIYRKIVADGQI